MAPKSKKTADNDATWKAFAFSAAIFPGLGQLAQGKRKLGGTIILLMCVLLYVFVGEAFSEIHAAAQRIIESGSSDYFRLHQESQQIIQNLNTPRFLFSFYGAIALWVFSFIEVFRKPPGAPEEEL